MINTVIYIGFGLMVVLLIASWVPWRKIFEKYWGNNPTKAKVYVESGEQIILCQGNLVQSTSKAKRFRYKLFNEWQTVLVPSNYPVRYVLGCRQIRVIHGQSSPAPLGGMQESAIIVSPDTLDAIFRAHIGKDLAKTVFGKTLNYMTVIMVIVGMAIAGYFLYQQFMAPDIKPPAGIEEPAPINNKPGILE